MAIKERGLSFQTQTSLLFSSESTESHVELKSVRTMYVSDMCQARPIEIKIHPFSEGATGQWDRRRSK